jgi:8-oxo-dGTP pyrophosphatase MutT (NUDIX family)
VVSSTAFPPLHSSDRLASAEPIFKAIATLLPQIAEEGELHKAIAVEDVDRGLSNALDCPINEARHHRRVVEKLFSVLSVLDQKSLSQGQWRFVSFPASLLARHLIASLAQPGQRLFPENYWEQGAHRPINIVEEQRDLLQALETRRLRFHPSDASPLPIRVVHVAWGVIRLEGRFLLLHREDKTRSRQGNFVLPGGRFNSADWPGLDSSSLAATQQVGMRLPPDVQERTLLRELEEELGLLPTQHFKPSHWRDIKPWRQIEGARNHHAYTEYLISLFQIELTAPGETQLYDQIAQQACAWFTLDEMEKQCLPDGTASYLDALLADFGADFAKIMGGVPESRPDLRLVGETEAIDFPFSTVVLRRGKTGKERPLKIELDNWQRAFLLALAWHAKGLPFVEVDMANRLPRGWIKLEEALVAPATSLARQLMHAGCPVLEINSSSYARINLHPDAIFLDPTVFRFDVRPEGSDQEAQQWRFDLISEPVLTPIGKTTGLAKSWPISRNTARIVIAIAEGKDPEADHRIKSGDIQKTLRDQVDQPLRAYGLRKLVRIEEGSFRLNVERRGYSGSSPLAKGD